MSQGTTRVNPPSFDPDSFEKGANGLWVPNFIGTRVYLSSNQTNIVTATWTKVTPQSSSYDIGSRWDGGNYKQDIDISGEYEIYFQIRWAPQVASKRHFVAIYNGLQSGGGTQLGIGIDFSETATEQFTIGCEYKGPLTAADDIYFYVYHEEGVNTPDLALGESQSFATIELIKKDTS